MSSTLIKPRSHEEADGPARPGGDPAWARPALILLLAATAVLYLWRLGDSGFANSFYSAAVQASTKSWKAFLTKMAQALIVVPVFALVYLLVAPTPVRRRLWQLAAAAAALVVASGWWVAIVELVPASARPYIGGSQDNSLLNLIFGYNGFGRLTGNETGSVGGGPAGAAGRWGSTGWTRLFGSDMGTQISWLLPTAIVLGAAILWYTRRRPRTDLTRAAGLVFAGWLGLTGVIFSFAQGIIHPYYTVALAPPIAALIGMGAVICWRERSAAVARASLAAATLAAGVWGYVLLDRTPSFQPELRVVVL